MATKLAAQLYTIRQFMKTPEDMAVSLKKIREMGWEAVQLSGHGPIDPEELRKLLDDANLEVCATHTGYERMRDNMDEVMEEHRILGCRNLAIGGLPGSYREKGAAGYAEFAREASQVAAKLAEHGFTWSYHNHSFELEKFDGRTALSILYEDSDPEYFLGEIDTYWIQHGGGDPAQWILDLKGRIKLLHLKDMGIANRQQIMTEVGEGNLNWPRILSAAAEAGVEWYIVEQDICQRDPFESLAISLRNLKAMGLS
ncbi:MAG: sugar phosphate isomerase/epimerase family protein [Limnochordia bacterium]|jgi:sugar phosphate isomerase/epimerase